MKYTLITLTALTLTLTACKDKEHPKPALDAATFFFVNDCASKAGKLVEVNPSKYTCTLPNGTVLVSK